MVWIKRLSFLMASLLAVLVIFIAYVTLLLNPNDFKEELTSIAREKANIVLRFDGDIKWSFYPWLGLELENVGVAIADKSAQGQAELLRFDRAEFGLALMPLLQKQIQVNKVNLVNVSANLIKNKQGQGNWQFVEQKPEIETPIISATTKPSAPKANASEEFSLPDLKLELLRIENAQLSYRDEQTDQLVNLLVNAQVDDVEWDRIWPVAMEVVFTQSDLAGQRPINVEAQLNANLSVFPGRQFFSIDSLVLNSTLQSQNLTIETIETKLKAMKIDFDLPQENVAVEGLSISALDVNLDANLQGYQVLTSPSFSADISLGEFSPKQVLSRLNLPVPDMSDDTALAKAQANFALEGDMQSVTLHPANIAFDDTTLEANAVVNLSPLRWDVRIEGENLNLDRYLPEQTENVDLAAPKAASESKAASALASAKETDLFPVEAIRALNGHVELSFDDLQVKNLKIDRVQLDSSQNQGLLKVSPMLVNLYDGDVEAKVSVDVRGDTPRIDIVPIVDGVQIQPLLTDFMEMEKVSGATYLTGSLVATGNQVDSLIASLSGDLLVEVKEGALVGINLTKSVCEGISSVRKESINDDGFTDDTPFESMSFPAHIINGQVSTPGLVIRSAGVQVTGDGIVSLTESSLDYEAQVGLAGSQLDDACRVNEKVAKLTFPIQCKGHFDDDPAGLCGPDIKGFASLFADLAKDELKAKAEEEKVRLQAELEEKLAVEKARIKAELEEKRQEELDALKDKLKNKLKSFF